MTDREQNYYIREKAKMKNSYINLLREPDSVLFQYEDSGIRFEEPQNREEQITKLEYIVKDGCADVIVYPCAKPIKRVKLRWRGDMSDCILTYGDAYERCNDAFGWNALRPERQMPWYFHAYDGEKLNSFGVKTGANAFCYFQCDPFGITLWLDLRNGGAGVHLKEPLNAVSVVCREGAWYETPYEAARNFCKTMCENPVLPEKPIFGVNNWYWAYGNISHNTVMAETDYLMEMCSDCVCEPHMVIDDGWQINRYSSEKQGAYNGGPWDRTNMNFYSMEETARKINEKGAKAGIWFRPLFTSIGVPEEMIMPVRYHETTGLILDPSHPEVLQMTYQNVAMIASWGYDLIKHDFTTVDVLKVAPGEEMGQNFYDNTLTNCQILKRLYSTIQSAAGNRVVIGCNTINHITAGIHACQRSGDDTSGRSFEITRKNGGRAMVRLPQNNTFFSVDPDCAAFTDMVDADLNLDFMEMCAATGVVTLASVTPGILTKEQMSRIRGIYKTASQGGLGATPVDWLAHNVASKYRTPDGTELNYDWYRKYDGTRSYHLWMF